VQKRYARRTVTRQREIVDFLKSAKIRLHGLIPADTRALIAKRKDNVFQKVRVTKEKVKKKIVVMVSL
jgi:hypothetical protein